VEKACQRFEQLGVNFIKKPSDGKMKGLAFVTDPDGYWIEILNPIHYKQWIRTYSKNEAFIINGFPSITHFACTIVKIIYKDSIFAALRDDMGWIINFQTFYIYYTINKEQQHTFEMNLLSLIVFLLCYGHQLVIIYRNVGAMNLSKPIYPLKGSGEIFN